jgi:hypothetical protein
MSNNHVDNILMQLALRPRVTCPHCWMDFPPEEVLWISVHPGLIGDPLLGKDAQQRFLPTRFDLEGHAIDVRGGSCRQLACPRCHLSIAQVFLETAPLFISILGGPSSGKSYYLAAMTWQLRKSLQRYFGLTFQDADPLANHVLTDYEEKLFLSSTDQELVTLPKTTLQGDLYESVKFGDQETWFPKPFVFLLQPLKTHPGYHKHQVYSKALCLYDNAGEHFLAGFETALHPIQHLAVSQALLFMFDPTQHAKFREKCIGTTNDPQMAADSATYRQDQILLEAANRIRSHTRIPSHSKYPCPLIIVLTKYDAWSFLIGESSLDLQKAIHTTKNSISGLDLGLIDKVSQEVRKLLLELAPEFVSAAEGFCEKVTYIPVSAMGGSPEVGKTGFMGVRPCNIKPKWVEIPMLYALHRAAPSLIRPIVRLKGSSPNNLSHAPPVKSHVDAKKPPPPPLKVWKDTGT